jgi:signal transduction histidine kinase/CheY-like chemotaxis protein/HPt (histidine-containing phosphotransfer) domain-containing protein
MVVAGLVAIVFVVLLVSVVDLRDDTQAGKRTTNLLTSATAADISVLDVETGLRGFLLTGQQRFLEPYRQASAMIGPQLAEMRESVASPSEKRRVGVLKREIDSYLSTYARPVSASAPHLSHHQMVSVVSRGKQLVDTMRAHFSALITTELATRGQRRSVLASETTRTIIIAAIGLAGSILLLVALCVYLLRDILRPTRRVSEAAGRLAGGELTVRVPEEGRGEVMLLGRSFNAMAGALETRDGQLVEANAQLERAVEVAEEASRMKSNFLANMSHELRTPLNGVVGMVNLLADTDLSDEQQEYVGTAHASSETLMTVINDILDVSKIEAGRLELEERDFDLHELVESNSAMLAAEASNKGLELHVSIGADVPHAVRGDRLRIGQILTNLLSNAVKFTAEGEVTVEVRVAERREAITDVCFAVRDTGIGIATDRLARLFDPFTQADTSTTRRFGGTGLGLTIIRDLVAVMGGTLDAESELGRGSTFRFTISLPPAADPLGPVAPPVELRGLRVLVTDDNPANRRILEAYVASWGMRPRPARDAADGFDQLQLAVDTGEPFDVALLDLNMPGESGLELARRIADSPRLRGTRLIMLTSSDASQEDLTVNGVAQHLIKPVRQSRLLEAIALAMLSELPAPRTPPAARASGRREAPLGTGGRTRTGCRILLAEDNAPNRLYVDRLLTRSGHSVDCAADGREAVRMSEAESYDLILMDCQMPELDGYDATREIRGREARHPGTHIPIVAMTAGALDGARELCLEAGMDDYVAKPFAQDELERVIARWLPGAEDEGGEVLDPTRLAELRDLFPGGEAATMLRNVVVTINADLTRLAARFADRDHIGLGATAHTLRGSARLVGAAALADALATLERHVEERGLAGEPPDPARLEDVRRSWSATLAALEAEIARS